MAKTVRQALQGLLKYREWAGVASETPKPILEARAALEAPDEIEVLNQRIQDLEGAEQTLLAIEQIIPRNDAHRDYVETVQLFAEAARRK